MEAKLIAGHHTEEAFEIAIEHHLTSAGGYVKGARDTHALVFQGHHIYPLA